MWAKTQGKARRSLLPAIARPRRTDECPHQPPALGLLSSSSSVSIQYCPNAPRNATGAGANQSILGDQESRSSRFSFTTAQAVATVSSASSEVGVGGTAERPKANRMSLSGSTSDLKKARQA
eukprot:252990-Prymnesium_polylepis.1